MRKLLLTIIILLFLSCCYTNNSRTFNRSYTCCETCYTKSKIINGVTEYEIEGDDEVENK